MFCFVTRKLLSKDGRARLVDLGAGRHRFWLEERNSVTPKTSEIEG